MVARRTVFSLASAALLTGTVTMLGGASASAQDLPPNACQPSANLLLGLNWVIGTNGNDVLAGTTGADLIVGLGGKDVIAGLGGDDVILGGAGDDIISGGPGDDCIDGNDGGDTVFGNAGADMLYGNQGGDHLYGYDAVDVEPYAADGSRPVNTLNGGQDVDLCVTGQYFDALISCEALYIKY